MLIQPDINELGDKRLNPAEANAKARADNLKASAKFRLPGQDELENQERSMGPRMHFSELILRLQKCNCQLLFRDGSPGEIAVYAPKNFEELRENPPDPSKPGWYNDHKYVGGFPKDCLPEYSHLLVDEWKRPKREVRGWRSVLLKLLQSHTISYRAMVQHFGPAQGENARRWDEQTALYRG